jgi:methyl coenzyme M reductase alpha subunit
MSRVVEPRSAVHKVLTGFADLTVNKATVSRMPAMMPMTRPKHPPRRARGGVERGGTELGVLAMVFSSGV